jgi:ribonucleoside-triphosphate reductase (formate)
MKCKQKNKIYSRITGYMRPINTWDKSKREDFRQRKAYQVKEL